MTMWLRLVVCSIVFAVVSQLLVGCSEERGRVRARADQLVGVYETALGHGRERLELESDGTYVQEFQAAGLHLRHTGRWKIENNFLDGSDVILVDAVVSKDPPDLLQTGEQVLNVHERSGEFSLALNETADWYFERAR